MVKGLSVDKKKKKAKEKLLTIHVRKAKTQETSKEILLAFGGR